MEPPPYIKSLILIAGLSGAGKTTFVNQLTSGELSADIMALLPRGADQWDQSTLSRLPELTSNKQLSGVIASENIRNFENNITGKIAENSIYKNLKLAQQITVITLRPDAEQLISHVDYRETGSQSKVALLIHMLRSRVAKFVFPFLRLCAKTLPEDFRSSIQGVKKVKNSYDRVNYEAVRTTWRKRAKYRNDLYVETIYKNWDEFLGLLEDSEVDFQCIDITPRFKPGARVRESWKVQSTVQRGI